MEGLPQEVVAALVLVCALALGSLAYALKRSRREARDAAVLERSRETETHLPASLHPVIDPNICIGSLSCVKACPEGDILGIVDNSGALISGANCIGHGRCAVECPVDAIKLVFGTSERGVDLPEVDEVFESSRAGVHIVGELGGMGLIRNAMTQGVQVGEFLTSAITQGRPPDKTAPAGSMYDVVIVGGGAAGLATALSCRAGGLSIKVLEQESMGGTVAHYPRQKIVMTEMVKLPIYGKFGKKYMSKEELLAGFEDIVKVANLPVTTGVKVTSIVGEDGAFLVRTENHGDFRCQKVVLAIGRRGTPRKMGVPGEDLSKVTYRLLDPEQYTGARVLVYGGGDSALEAAASLCEAGARVTIAYRGPNFVRSRMANQERVMGLIKDGRIVGLFNTTVAGVRENQVVLDTPEGRRELANDFVLALLGGELPTEFLKKNGVEMTRHFGVIRPSRAGKKEHLDAGVGKAAAHTARDDAAKRARLARALTVVGAVIVGYLAWIGREYYLLDAVARKGSPLHSDLRSSGPWGHGVGLVATLFMLSNFVYAARKRLRIFKGDSPIRTWLTWHMFVGFMSPLVIAFHAAFQSKNLLATSTSLALLVVVSTGAVGRYIYGLVPSGHGKADELAELRARWERLRASLSPEHTVNGFIAHGALDDPPKGGSLLVHLLRMPFESLRWRLAMAKVSRTMDEGHARDVVESLQEARLLRTQIGFYRSLKRLLSWWRILHVVLAVFLVFAIALHVGVSIYLGYGWGWGGKA